MVSVKMSISRATIGMFVITPGWLAAGDLHCTEVLPLLTVVFPRWFWDGDCLEKEIGVIFICYPPNLFGPVHPWTTCRLFTMDHLWNLSHTAGILVSYSKCSVGCIAYITAPVRIPLDSDHHSAGRCIVRQGWFTSWRRSHLKLQQSEDMEALVQRQTWRRQWTNRDCKAALKLGNCCAGTWNFAPHTFKKFLDSTLWECRRLRNKPVYIYIMNAIMKILLFTFLCLSPCLWPSAQLSS